MKNLSIVSMLLIALVTLSFSAEMKHGDGHNHKEHKKTEAHESKMQSICPVMGGGIQKDIYADHNGKRVYFCCQMCIDEFKKDPEQYINKVKESGEKLFEFPDVEDEIQG